MDPAKKRTFSKRQLESILDGNYWSVSSSSRTKKPTPNTSFANITPTEELTQNPKTTSPTTSPSKKFQDSNLTHSSPQTIPATLRASADDQSNPFSHSSSSSHYKNEPHTSHSYDIPFSIYPDEITSSTTSTPAPLHPSDQSTTNLQANTSSSSTSTFPSSIPIAPPLPPNKIKSEDTKNMEKKANIELDGSYWSTFDVGIKRKKERALSDITAVDADYWNKRNARVQIPKKPAPQLTDEQLAKRAEKLARSREEHRLREDAAHERIARKQEEARVGKEVFKGIFLGGKHAAKNWEFFEKSQIRAVINVTSEVPNYHEKNGAVKYIKVHVSDLPTVDLLETFEKLSDSIYELTQQGNVLIHCKEGKSRSPSICMAFAMKYLKMNLAEAHESITKKSEIRVNLGFQQQLMGYERRILNTEVNTFNFLQKRNNLP